MVLAAGVRWASRGKDAGSADSGVLSARPRTPHLRRSSAALRHSHYFAKDPYVRAV